MGTSIITNPNTYVGDLNNLTTLDKSVVGAINTLNSNLEYFRTSPDGFPKSITGSTVGINTNGFYWCESTSDTPSPYGYLIVSHHASKNFNHYKQIFFMYNTQQVYVRTFVNGAVVGSGWEELALNSNITWKFGGTVSGNTVLSLPTSHWKELWLRFRWHAETKVSFSIIISNNPNAERHYTAMGYLS